MQLVHYLFAMRGALGLLLRLALAMLLVVRAFVAGSYLSSSLHTNNWVVLVDTSRFWFNYRHAANALSMYRTVKELGVPDDRIILMLADDVACNARNVMKARVYNNKKRQLELYGDNVEVDYRGDEVTVEAFLRVLTGRHLPGTPASKRMDSDAGSNIFVFMTGHGGDEFLKFQDAEEISSQDIAEAFDQMHAVERYNEILFMVDTCQASTLFSQFRAPNVVSIGSSQKGENSYSHHQDEDIGLAVIDRFTYYTLDFFENEKRRGNDLSDVSLLKLFRSFDSFLLRSSAQWTSTLSRSLASVKLTDFFGARLTITPDFT